jgi:outer membrane protein TolC
MSAFLILAMLNGCRQHCFMTEGDFNSHHDLLLSSVPDEHGADAVAVADSAPVSTALNPEGQQRFISLKECIALALENGRVGTTNIRVLAYDPAIAYTPIEQSLARYDTHWRQSLVWNHLDEQVATGIQNVLVGMMDDRIKDEAVSYISQLVKPLPTGGIAGITFRTDYDSTNQVALVNPSWRTRIVFGFEQPLLQGFGVAINQVRASHPGGVLLGGGGGGEGILITRLNYDQVRDRFAGRVQDLLFSVEEAYWNLYLSHWSFANVDAATTQAYAAWEQAKRLFDAKQIGIGVLAEFEQQYHAFRLQRLEALSGSGRSVLDAERQLRFVVGLPPEDGTRLIPTDTPVTAPFHPDWHEALVEAMNNRPELIDTRQDIQRLSMEIARARDLALPDLRAIGNFDINGLGHHLLGTDNDSAFRQLGANRFHDWTVGLQMDIPIGFRDANAQIRRGQLQITQRSALLRDQESQAVFALQRSYRRLVQAQERMRIQSALARAADEELQSVQRQFQAREAPVNFLVDARRNSLIIALEQRSSVLEYNIALADFERQKGTLMKYDNVTIAEGPLPECAQAGASKHIRECHKAVVHQTSAGADGAHAMSLGAQSDNPPEIPKLLDKGSLSPAPEKLPDVPGPIPVAQEPSPPAVPQGAGSPGKPGSPYVTVGPPKSAPK